MARVLIEGKRSMDDGDRGGSWGRVTETSIFLFLYRAPSPPRVRVSPFTRGMAIIVGI